MVVTVYDEERAIVMHRELNWRIDMAYLMVLGCQGAVTAHDTVKAESLEVRLVVEVASVKHLAIAYDTLVDPVPDESSEHTGIGVNLIPVLLEIPQGVAHAVGVFRGEDRACVCHTVEISAREFPLSLGYCKQMLPSCILGAFLVRALWNAGVKILVHDTWVEA